MLTFNVPYSYSIKTNEQDTVLIILMALRLGVSLPSLTPDERKSMFTAMDANGDGAISFDEWLSFSMTNIIAKIN